MPAGKPEAEVAVDDALVRKLLRDQHPDLLVLDLLMPRMTGFDVLREMQADERIRDTPTLVMSGVWKSNVREFLRELGAQDFLEKEQIRRELVPRARRILSLGTPSAS